MLTKHARLVRVAAGRVSVGVEGKLYWIVPGVQCQVVAGHVSVGKRVRFTGWYLVRTVR